MKGVTPSSAESWLSLSLTGRFDVTVNGEVIGRVTANPTADQVASGQTDTITIPANSTGEVALTPVAEDFADGFVCEGSIPVSLAQGEANQKTVFAYAKRGLFTLSNISAADGSALGSAEFVVMNAQGVMQWSFTTDENGAYTAKQALPNGDYQLVQMRAPQGMMLLDQPISFSIGTYFGSAESMTALTVKNDPAPTNKGAEGNLTLTVGDFTAQDGQMLGTLNVSGLCGGENNLPLGDYTVTIAPATLCDQQGNAVAANQAVFVDAVTVNRTEGSCSIQPLDAAGQPAGDAVPAQPGETVTIGNAAGAAITYLDANGAATLPVGFNAGTVDVRLRYEPVAFLPTEHAAATARLNVGVSYTYEYAGTDGISKVTAQSAIEPKTAALNIPDGRIQLAVNATAETLEDGTPVIAIAAATQALPADALAMAMELPAGVRVLDSALEDGLQVLRTAQQDTVLFDSARWAAGAVKVPVAAGDVSAFTVWVLDPCTLPVTVDAPEGDTIRAVAHEAKPVLDALLGKTGGRYARMDVTLPSAIVTGKTSGALSELLSGTVTEQAQQPTTAAANLGVVLAGANPKVIYGTATDANGAFAVSGDAAETVGTLHVALPVNTMSVATHETSADTEANVKLPQSGYTVAFVKMSGVSGLIASTDGKPVAGATMQLLQNGQPAQTATTDAAGRYTFAGLEAGRLRIANFPACGSQRSVGPRRKG